MGEEEGERGKKGRGEEGYSCIAVRVSHCKDELLGLNSIYFVHIS